MRARTCCTGFLGSLLKLLNFLQTFAGVSIVIYSAWMLSQWNRRTGPNLTVSADPSQIEVGFYSAFENGLHLVLDKLPAPWFIYSFMGVGVMVCLITFIGHVAAEAVNGCCLCFVSFFVVSVVGFSFIGFGIFLSKAYTRFDFFIAVNDQSSRIHPWSDPGFFFLGMN